MKKDMEITYALIKENREINLLIEKGNQVLRDWAIRNTPENTRPRRRKRQP